MEKKSLTKCIFCSCTKLYHVSDTQYKCATCKRKFSHKKYLQELLILEYFIENSSAKACSKELTLNYLTVKKIYTKARHVLLSYAEKSYQNQEKNFSQYDEYYYLPQAKKTIAHLFDAIGILGMLYGEIIYTLLLPDQFSHLKHANEDETILNAYKEEYAKYLNYHKVAHYKAFDNKLSQFWSFLETFMLHFKGVSKKEFIYYLKEAEFKFNHTKKEQKEILIDLWHHYM